ncbi:MAG TPA: 50S ribosomal protein L6 [Candidatus Manganitrophaceae bacterium]|nr:50S ribosomal protein L6 [Candidatus Manganitrophaceae bacterium]
MSRVGLKKIAIPSGVNIKVNDQTIHIKGPKGENQKPIRPEVAVAIQGNEVIVSRSSDERFVRSLHGLTRNEINNMIQGVTQGYDKVLEINGVGYRATVQGRNLVLNLGFSHPINFELPKGIDATVEKNTIVTIKGIDKYLVGEVAAKIRALKKPEPYKGKGVKYRDERIIRKEGKTGK